MTLTITLTLTLPLTFNLTLSLTLTLTLTLPPPLTLSLTLTLIHCFSIVLVQRHSTAVCFICPHDDNPRHSRVGWQHRWLRVVPTVITHVIVVWGRNTGG
jgi:hypothetical protein